MVAYNYILVKSANGKYNDYYEINLFEYCNPAG